MWWLPGAFAGNIDAVPFRGASEFGQLSNRLADRAQKPNAERSSAGRTTSPATLRTELKPRMATDYDAPRRGDVDELNEDSIEELKARRAEAQSGSIDVDETELAESLELPGADLSSMSGEELTVRVLPKQSDEFTCSVCFLVHHRSRLARERKGQLICRDCV
jgi:hypothetical protein